MHISKVNRNPFWRINKKNLLRCKEAKMIILSLPLLIISISGCSLSKHLIYINPEADMKYYEKIAIIPFGNLTSDRAGGDKVTEVFMTELLISQKFKIVDPGDFYHAVTSITQQSGPIGGTLLNHTQLKFISDKLGIQGIIEGVVHTLEMTRIGQEQYPVISLTVRLIDSQTGTIVWQSSYTRKGGPTVPILSVGETYTLEKLTQQACIEIIKKFRKEALAD